MAFDPFNDFETKGYLHNVAGAKDRAIVARLEHNAFAGNIERALRALQNARQIDLEAVQETHRILFQDVYPWAGQDRSKNASTLSITKGDVEFQLAPFVPQGVAHALKNGSDAAKFRADPGKVIGELAYAHPFLDGNGRTIMAVVSELSRRAGFHIAWEDTSKDAYLKALTQEIDDPNKGHLTRYLKPHIRFETLGVEQEAASLTTLPGLSAPGRQTSEAERPTLTIIAGPNGAGKSTLTASGAFKDLPVIDPDAIARTLNPADPESAARRAGKKALDLRRDFLEKQTSFAIETTLSGNSTLALIDEAKQHGFRVALNFIGLESVDLAKARVASRVASGGHNVPQEDIERRFARSFENVPDAISKADEAVLYDNTGPSPLRRIAELSRERFSFENAPVWATDAAFSAAQTDLGKAETVQELERATKRAFDAARAAGVESDQLQWDTKQLEQKRQRQHNPEGHDL